MRKRVAAIVSVILVGTAWTEVPAQRFGLLHRLREARAGAAPKTDGAVSVPLSFGGLDRHYQLLDVHRGHAPAPLVIVLHGGGGNGGTMIARWSGQARSAGLVVAAPDGIGRRDRMGTWNAGGCCGEAMSRGVDDVGFVRAVAEDVARRTAIDPAQIYIVGFSNGAMLAHRVAITMGDRIAAAAMVSGAIFGNEPRPVAAVPVLIIHGEKDDVVAFSGGKSPTGFVARAQMRPFLPTRQSVDFWRQADGCAASPGVTRQPGLVIEHSMACAKGGEVVFYDIPGGGHEWPGAAKRPASSGGGDTLDATDVIWRFFQDHHR